MRHLLIAVTFLELAVPAAAVSATPRHTVNLANGKFDGRAILGLTPAQVRTVLGKPDSAGGSKARYQLIWGTFPNIRFTVIFTKRGTHERAVVLAFETGIFRDPKLGDILERRPSAFQSAMRASYGDVYRLVNPLKHKPGGLYAGEFRQRDGTLHVSFGTHLKLGTFVTVWDYGG